MNKLFLNSTIAASNQTDELNGREPFLRPAIVMNVNDSKGLRAKLPTVHRDVILGWAVEHVKLSRPDRFAQ